MNNKEAINYCLDSIKKAGGDKAACSLSLSEKKELNVEIGEMTLLRTTFNANLGISVIKDQKKGSTLINKIDKENIDSAIDLVMNMAEGCNVVFSFGSWFVCCSYLEVTLFLS